PALRAPSPMQDARERANVAIAPESNMNRINRPSHAGRVNAVQAGPDPDRWRAVPAPGIRPQREPGQDGQNDAGCRFLPAGSPAPVCAAPGLPLQPAPACAGWQSLSPDNSRFQNAG